MYRTVQIVDEETIRSARLFAQCVDPREHPVSLARAVELSGNRHRDVVLDLERQLRPSRIQQGSEADAEAEDRQDTAARASTSTYSSSISVRGRL
jgi:hypothetical protein